MPLSRLSEAETAHIRLLRSKGVLQEIKGDKLPCEHGTIIVPCSDGHHFSDFYGHHSEACRMTSADPMHHPIALCGGALLIPVDSPLLFENTVRHRDDDTALRHIRLSIGVKGARAVVLAAHAPCGMAREYGLSIDDSLELLVKAKDRVRAMLEDEEMEATVSAHFHVFDCDGRRLSYHLDRSAWNAMRLEATVTNTNYAPA